MHHLTPERLRTLLAHSEVIGLSSEARERLQWIATYVSEGLSVSETCARFNIARSTFHRWIKRFDPDDLSTLEEQTHAPHEARTSNVDQATADLIREYRKQEPLAGKEKIHAMLLRDHNIHLSPSSIGRIIERDGLYFAATPLHWKKRTGYQSKVTSYEDVKLREMHQEKTEVVDSQLAARSSGDHVACSCFWCSFWKSHGRSVRRTFGVASLAINIAVLALYGATIFWENDINTQTTQADLLMHSAGTVSNLDAPAFNEQ